MSWFWMMHKINGLAYFSKINQNFISQPKYVNGHVSYKEFHPLINSLCRTCSNIFENIFECSCYAKNSLSSLFACSQYKTIVLFKYRFANLISQSPCKEKQDLCKPPLSLVTRYLQITFTKGLQQLKQKQQDSNKGIEL